MEDLNSPEFDAGSGRKISSHQQVTDLSMQKLHDGTIYHLSGSVLLHTLHSDLPERLAIYHRDVLFITGDKPYVIDLNSITNNPEDDLASFYMQYYGHGSSLGSEGQGWTSWQNPYTTNDDRLFIDYNAV